MSVKTVYACDKCKKKKDESGILYIDIFKAREYKKSPKGSRETRHICLGCIKVLRGNSTQEVEDVTADS